MNELREKILFMLVIILFASLPVQAQRILPRPPLFGIPAKTLPQNHWVFRGYWINNNYNKTWNSVEGKMVDVPSNFDFTSNVVWGKIRYGITNKLTFICNIPYVHKSLSKNGIEKTGSDLGDVIGALLYKFYSNKVDKFLLSGLLFTKSPTGKSVNLAPDELPVGTGSFDYGASILPEKEFGKWDLRFSAFYLIRGRNADDINLGDVLSFSWSSAYNFSKRLIIENTFYYKRVFENSKNGNDITGSDVYLFQIIPALEYRFGNSFFLQAVLPINIAQKRPFGNTYESWFGLYYMI